MGLLGGILATGGRMAAAAPGMLAASMEGERQGERDVMERERERREGLLAKALYDLRSAELEKAKRPAAPYNADADPEILRETALRDRRLGRYHEAPARPDGWNVAGHEYATEDEALAARRRFYPEAFRDPQPAARRDPQLDARAYANLRTQVAAMGGDTERLAAYYQRQVAAGAATPEEERAYELLMEQLRAGEWVRGEYSGPTGGAERKPKTTADGFPRGR